MILGAAWRRADMGKSGTRTLRGKICNGSDGTQRALRAGKGPG